MKFKLINSGVAYVELEGSEDEKGRFEDLVTEGPWSGEMRGEIDVNSVLHSAMNMKDPDESLLFEICRDAATKGYHTVSFNFQK